MNIQNILSSMRRAIEDYSMIKDGDKIAVGLSGGKDSLVLLKALATYKIFSPEKFDLCAITIDLGLGTTDFTALTKFCEDLKVPYHIEHTNIGPIIFEERKESSPCSLCSKMRRGALNTCLLNMGYDKLALGHHADDLVETMLLSMFYEGRLSTFAPTSFMDRTGVTLIRPLIYTQEKNIIAAAKEFPVMKNPCPKDHFTQREYMKNLMAKIVKDIPFAKDRLLSAIINPERYNLWDKYEKAPKKERTKSK